MEGIPALARRELGGGIVGGGGAKLSIGAKDNDNGEPRVEVEEEDGEVVVVVVVMWVVLCPEEWIG